MYRLFLKKTGLVKKRKGNKTYKEEKLHSNVRARTKTFRGFHGSVESARAIMNGYVIFYNFIRKHLSLKGKTPSEFATDIKLKKNNKWLELINMSNVH